MTEGLTSLLRKAEVGGVIRGHSVCQAAPPVSHLLFADDSIFFCKASVPQARAVKSILELYGSASSQCINVEKSSVFFVRGISQDREMTFPWSLILGRYSLKKNI